MTTLTGDPEVRLEAFDEWMGAWWPSTPRDPGELTVWQLDRAWRRHRDRLIRFARERAVSLWLTEVGYPSRDGAATRPWDYTAGGPIDLEEQRRCFAALIAAWDGRPELAGILVWNWWGEGGARDGDYTPRGKPAERLLRDWFAGRRRM